jgi:glycosyltransferase involved in cell wall biosynthesis
MVMPANRKVGFCAGGVWIGNRTADVDESQYELLQAAQTVVREFPQAQFILVGDDYELDGQYRLRLRAIVEQLDLSQHVTFTGFRADARRSSPHWTSACRRTPGQPITELRRPANPWWPHRWAAYPNW